MDTEKENEITVNEQVQEHSHEVPALKVCKNKSCQKEFKPRQNNRSSFCSEKCRILHKSGLSGIDQQVKPSTPSIPEKVSLPTPRVTGLEPHLQMAFDMLVANEKQWKEWYQEKSKALNEAQDEIKRLNDKLKDKEHEEQLSGIEDAKPTILGKILGEIPAAWQEAIAPAIGALAQKAASQMNGVGGQLDDATQHMLDWIRSQPEEIQQELSVIVATWMGITDQATLADVLRRINSLLTGGSTVSKEQPKQNAAPQPNVGQLMMGL